MKDVVTFGPVARHSRRATIIAYAPVDDDSSVEFEIEWSGHLHRWVIVDAYNDVLINVHNDRRAPSN